jgi:hypothetical protein
LPKEVETLVLAERANGLHVSLRSLAGEGGQGDAGTFRLTADGPVAAAPLRASEAAVVLDGHGARAGVRFPSETTTGESCPWSLLQQPAAGGKPTAVLAKSKGQPGFVLASSFGVGLAGLPFE